VIDGNMRNDDTTGIKYIINDEQSNDFGDDTSFFYIISAERSNDFGGDLWF
jgi:hypothetical protein